MFKQVVFIESSDKNSLGYLYFNEIRSVAKY